MRVIGYVRVSTSNQAANGTSLRTQREVIKRECAHRGWELLDVVAEDHSARSRRNPPLRQQVLERLAAGEADVLMAAKLDRLSRSQHDFSGMLLAAEDQGWKVVVLDIGVDTTTSTGKMIAGVVVSIAEWESDRRSERIREVGTAGRRRQVPDAVVTRIRRSRARGMSYQRIAERLNRDGVPGGRGGRWYAATVRSLLRSTGAR